MTRPFDSPLAPVLRATVSPRTGTRSEARARARSMVDAMSRDARGDLHLAAALGDAVAVTRALEADPAGAARAGGPFQWDPLTHLCFSVLLDGPDADGGDFVGAAEALLAAGASANTGFRDPKAEPGQDFRSALYGASCLGRHLGLTNALLAHGADPNDPEVAYHLAEGYDNRVLEAVVAHGRCTPSTLATLLRRKCDWHDVRGVHWLLAHGADPRVPTAWPGTTLLHALERDCSVEIVQSLLDAGADPLALEPEDLSPVAYAARCGRGDVLDAMARRGIPLRLTGVDALLAACARGHGPAVRTIANTMPAAVDELEGMAGAVLVRFAGNANSAGIRLLLEIGLPVDARHREGVRYHDYAPMSTALHAAAWRGHPAVVRALLAGGADPNTIDAADRTPLQLAVRACVDSHWTDRRSPESVEALLAAGARVVGIAQPCGYDAVDALLSGR